MRTKSPLLVEEKTTSMNLMVTHGDLGRVAPLAELEWSGPA